MTETTILTLAGSIGVPGLIAVLLIFHLGKKLDALRQSVEKLCECLSKKIVP